MKWNKHAKLTATATSALLFTLLLMSCSNDNNNDNVKLPVNTPVQQEQTDQDHNKEEAEGTDSSNSPQNNEDATEPTSTPIIQDTTIYEVNGHYIGAIDNNSIEVEIDGEPVVFQLTDAFDYVISDFAEHSKVNIKYNKQITEDGNYVQNVVTAISNAK